MIRNAQQRGGAEIGYVLKSYPRMSETFIANEIYRLEQLGLPLRLYSILDLSDPQRHAVVDATRAPVQYLPQVTSLSETSFINWLRLNAPKFSASHRALFRAHPWRYLRTFFTALRFARKYRTDAAWQPNRSSAAVAQSPSRPGDTSTVKPRAARIPEMATVSRSQIAKI